MKIDKKIIIISSIVILLVLALVSYFVFFSKEEYKLTFDVNGGESIKSAYVVEDETYKLTTPKKKGYVFAGWLNEKGKIVTGSIKVTEDITLEASWISEKAVTYSVSFDTDGGSKIDSIIVEEGSEIQLPTEPKKDGYKFIDWVTEEDVIVTEDYVINEDVKLLALWEKNKTDKEPSKEPAKEPVKDSGKEEDKPVTKEYFCDRGYKLEGTKCTREVKKRALTKSVCPEGTTLDSGKCVEKVDYVCLDEDGDLGVYTYDNVAHQDVCYYGEPKNTQDQEECDNFRGYQYKYGCYPIKTTGDKANEAKQCPRGAREIRDDKRFYICVMDHNKVNELYCPEGKLIKHEDDGTFCLVTQTVDAKTK